MRSRSKDMDEGLPIIIEATLRCFLHQMENAPGGDNMEAWLSKFMQQEVRPHDVGELLNRFATPEKAVLRFLAFVESAGLAQTLHGKVS